MVVETFPLAPLIGDPVKEDFATIQGTDSGAEPRWENEGGRLRQQQRFVPADSNATVRDLSDASLELVTTVDGAEAILYIYRSGNFARTMVGSFTTLQEYARREYAGAPIHEVYPSTPRVR